MLRAHDNNARFLHVHTVLELRKWHFARGNESQTRRVDGAELVNTRTQQGTQAERYAVLGLEN
jgi:hypothetical protein